MTDSDKDLTQRLRQYLNSKYEVTMCYNGLRDEAANRIDELVERNKELTLQLLATSGQAADALDKLTKAVELALEECPFRAGTPKYDKWWHHRRATLAEIKGESHE